MIRYAVCLDKFRDRIAISSMVSYDDTGTIMYYVNPKTYEPVDPGFRFSGFDAWLKDNPVWREHFRIGPDLQLADFL
jgi:hypothetical protein